MSTKKCPFCNGSLSRNSSNEHIIPKWLMGFLNISDEMVTPTHQSSKDGRIVSKRRHLLTNLVSGGICANCNNGWMSDLETENMATLKALIKGSLKTSSLVPSQKWSIARWIFKTAMMLNYGSNYTNKIPLDHFQYLYKHDDSLPDRVCVVIYQYPSNEAFHWIQGLPWMCESDDGVFDQARQDDLLSRGWKTGFQFGELFAVVAYNPFPDCLFLYWRNVLTPLYPFTGQAGFFDREPRFEQENWKVLTELGMGVQLVHRDYRNIQR